MHTKKILCDLGQTMNKISLRHSSISFPGELEVLLLEEMLAFE